MTSYTYECVKLYSGVMQKYGPTKNAISSCHNPHPSEMIIIIPDVYTDNYEFSKLQVIPDIAISCPQSTPDTQHNGSRN